MIEYYEPQPIVNALALPISHSPDRGLAEALLRDSDPGIVLWLAVEHVMELAHAAQRAEVLKRERGAQEPVTVGPELADKVWQRAERDAEGRCCPRSVGEFSPTYCQYSSRGCSS